LQQYLPTGDSCTAAQTTIFFNHLVGVVNLFDKSSRVPSSWPIAATQTDVE
jgi:hypothetical protein